MKSRSKFFLGLILVTFIIALGVFLSKASPTAKKSDDSTKLSSVQSTDDNSTSVSDGILFLTNSSDATNIYSFSPSDKTKKIIFTDKDENLKIKQCQSLTLDGKKILATFGTQNDNFISSLWFIASDGKGDKEKLLDNFASPSAPIISPDGKKIAYTVFSNVEFDYGFSLLTANTDGTNKQTIDKDKGSIANINFSPDGQYILYTKGTESGKSGLYKTNLNSHKNEEIYSLKDKEAIYSVTVSKNNQVAISMGTIGNNLLNEAEIYILDINGKNMSKLFSNDTHENYLSFSPDGTKLAYLSIKYDANPKNANIPGTINLADVGNKTFVSLGQDADVIIGWLVK